MRCQSFGVPLVALATLRGIFWEGVGAVRLAEVKPHAKPEATPAPDVTTVFSVSGMAGAMAGLDHDLDEWHQEVINPKDQYQQMVQTLLYKIKEEDDDETIQQLLTQTVNHLEAGTLPKVPPPKALMVVDDDLDDDDDDDEDSEGDLDRELERFERQMAESRAAYLIERPIGSGPNYDVDADTANAAAAVARAANATGAAAVTSTETPAANATVSSTTASTAAAGAAKKLPSPGAAPGAASFLEQQANADVAEVSVACVKLLASVGDKQYVSAVKVFLDRLTSVPDEKAAISSLRQLTPSVNNVDVWVHRAMVNCLADERERRTVRMAIARQGFAQLWADSVLGALFPLDAHFPIAANGLTDAQGNSLLHLAVLSKEGAMLNAVLADVTDPVQVLAMLTHVNLKKQSPLDLGVSEGVPSAMVDQLRSAYRSLRENAQAA